MRFIKPVPHTEPGTGGWHPISDQPRAVPAATPRSQAPCPSQPHPGKQVPSRGRAGAVRPHGRAAEEQWPPRARRVPTGWGAMVAPVQVSRGAMHTRRDAASQSHTQPSPKMNRKLGSVGSCKASWAAARCSAGAQQTNTKYLISQELTQTERGRSGCSPPRSNPRLGREISSRERMASAI